MPRYQDIFFILFLEACITWIIFGSRIFIVIILLFPKTVGGLEPPPHALYRRGLSLIGGRWHHAGRGRQFVAEKPFLWTPKSVNGRRILSREDNYTLHGAVGGGWN